MNSKDDLRCTSTTASTGTASYCTIVEARIDQGSVVEVAARQRGSIDLHILLTFVRPQAVPGVLVSLGRQRRWGIERDWFRHCRTLRLLRWGTHRPAHPLSDSWARHGSRKGLIQRGAGSVFRLCLFLGRTVFRRVDSVHDVGHGRARNRMGENVDGLAFDVAWSKATGTLAASRMPSDASLRRPFAFQTAVATALANRTIAGALKQHKSAAFEMLTDRGHAFVLRSRHFSHA